MYKLHLAGMKRVGTDMSDGKTDMSDGKETFLNVFARPPPLQNIALVSIFLPDFLKIEISDIIRPIGSQIIKWITEDNDLIQDSASKDQGTQNQI